MGLLLCFIQIIAEVLGLGYAYIFGAYVLGALFTRLYHYSLVQMIHTIPTLFPHFPHAWATALLGITAMHIGIFWIALYLSLRLLFVARALPHVHENAWEPGETRTWRRDGNPRKPVLWTF